MKILFNQKSILNCILVAYEYFSDDYIYIYIYIYMYVLFGPVKPELGVIQSGQENYSRVNI